MTDMTKIEVKGGDMDEKTRDTRRERYKGKVFEKLTDAQWDAVETPGKVLVEAAAGTGKTSAMIGRIVAKIVDGVPIGRILVLVFNEAAAAEIKERLHTALFEAACLAEGEAAEEETSSDLGAITVVSREDGSGTRGAFIELLGIEQEDESGEKVDMTVDTAEITNSTAVMMTTIGGNKAAIGYISLGSLDDSVKAVTIDGVEATTDNVKSGDYAVARPFNIATKGAPDEATQDHVN